MPPVGVTAPDGREASDPHALAEVAPVAAPIPVMNPRKDGYIGSVTHAELGAVYNQFSLASPRVITRIVDELQGMFIAYG